MSGRIRATIASLALLAPAGVAFGDDDGGCVWNREVFPVGSEVCQGETLKRCEDGAWADIGMCSERPGPPPRAGGGDRDLLEDD